MRKLRLAYLSGPVNAADVHDRWTKGRQTELFGTSYLMQFFQLCHEIGAESLVITTLPDTLPDYTGNGVEIANYTPSTRSGFLYHVTSIWKMLKIGFRIARFRPEAVVITAHHNYWFSLFFLRLFSVEIIPSLHGALWPQHSRMHRHLAALIWMNSLFLRACVKKALAISPLSARQIEEISNGMVDTAVIRPTYAREQFQNVAPAEFSARPFLVLFAGRAESNKGIFDLVDVAEMLDTSRPGEFIFDICGEGSDLAKLKERVAASGLENTVRIYGFCNRDKLTQLLAKCHVVITPTRSELEEGLNKSCVESILAGRPLISSIACPAVELLEEASVVVEADNPSAYFEAIVSLADSKAHYARRRDACRPLQNQFYDPANSYAAALRTALEETGIISDRR